MRHRSFITALFLALLSLLVNSEAKGQQLLLSASSEADGDGGNLAWSVGQIAYHFLSGDGGSLLEGIQQPWELQPMPGIEDGWDIDFVFSVYPNPATTYVRIEVSPAGREGLTYTFRDMSGRVLRSSLLEEAVTTIPVGDLPAEPLILTIREKNRVIATYKLIRK